MKCNIMSWNVRGLGSFDGRRLLQELVSRYKPGIVNLQETKMKRMERDIVRSLCYFSSVH